MEIGMIGAGQVGSALARRFKAVGHDVLSANSPHPDTLATLAVAIGADPVTSFEAARAGDVVVTAIPLIAILELGKPKEDRGRAALPVAADRQTDKHAVKQLIDQTGFDPIDAGDLDESWRQEPATPKHATDLGVVAGRRALAEARSERKPECRATEKSPGTFANPV